MKTFAMVPETEPNRLLENAADVITLFDDAAVEYQMTRKADGEARFEFAITANMILTVYGGDVFAVETRHVSGNPELDAEFEFSAAREAVGKVLSLLFGYEPSTICLASHEEGIVMNAMDICEKLHGRLPREGERLLIWSAWGAVNKSEWFLVGSSPDSEPEYKLILAFRPHN